MFDMIHCFVYFIYIVFFTRSFSLNKLFYKKKKKNDVCKKKKKKNISLIL